MSDTDTTTPLQALQQTPMGSPDSGPDSGFGLIDNAVYTDQDHANMRQVADWLRTHGRPRSWLAAKLRISGATVSTVLSGKYPSSPTSHLSNMLAVIALEAARLADGTPGYIEGSVHKLITVVCDRTRKHQNFGVVCGHVGVGKTRSLKEYRVRHPQTVLIEANPAMTAGSLLVELLEQLGTSIPAGLDRKFQEIVKALAGTNYLLVIDEAENLSAQALHYLRRIRDKAQVGIVLAGTPRLHALIKPENGQFDQIRSRVSMWPATITSITRDDHDDMARDAMSDAGEIPDDVLEALWAFSDGSARVLMESLVPALRDYAIAKGTPLTARLVDAVASKVLFMTRRRTTGAA